MKNILLFMPYGSVGGMERLALSFYNFYKKEGYHVTAVKIIGLSNDIISFADDELVLSRKDFCEYSRIKRLKFYLSIPFRLRKIIKERKIHYTISFGDMANSFSALTYTSEKKIGSIHALKSVELVASSNMNKLFRLSYRTIYKKLTKVVCISKSIEEDLIKNLNYSFKNLEVIYNPHDIDKILKMSLESLESKEEELFRNNKIILFLGRLSLQKSPWHLIKAFSLMQSKEHKLVFIGDGDPVVKKILNELINSLDLTDRVLFLGRKDNPYKYLKAADILALSSLYEGTPNVIVEAIALGVPVVTSNCTDGVLEMMIGEKNKKINNFILTDSGIITPSFFKTSLEYPSSFSIIEEEKVFAEAIDYINNNRCSIDRQLVDSQQELLVKYDLTKVCINYLE